MSHFLCEHCQAAIIDSPKGYMTGCAHWPLEGDQPWKEGNPLFNMSLYDIRRANGTEIAGVEYHGNGMFGAELYDDVTHWRISSFKRKTHV